MSIDRWGENQRTSFERAFAGVSGLAMLAEDTPQWQGQSARVSMSGMFQSTTNLTGTFTGWDVSQVTSMANMFADAKGFNQSLS